MLIVILLITHFMLSQASEHTVSFALVTAFGGGCHDPLVMEEVEAGGHSLGCPIVRGGANARGSGRALCFNSAFFTVVTSAQHEVCPGMTVHVLCPAGPLFSLSRKAKHLSPRRRLDLLCLCVFRAQNLGKDSDSLRLLSAPLLGDRSGDPRDLVSLAPSMTLR